MFRSRSLHLDMNIMTVTLEVLSLTDKAKTTDRSTALLNFYFHVRRDFVYVASKNSAYES